MKKASVIIITLNYNQNHYTINCVNSLLMSDYINFKVMLIDNGSSEANIVELEESLSSDDRIILHKIEKNCGYVGGVNYGLTKAAEFNPDYYIIMNNDTIIDKHAISELVKTADKYEQKAIVSGKVYHMDDPDVIQLTGILFTDNLYLKGYSPGKNEKDVGQFDKEAERDSLDDIIWILPKKIVDDIGHYCNYFFLYAEQGDYAQKARRNGYKLIYTPKVKIWHKGSITSGDGNVMALPVCYWRAKSSFIFSYRNLKRKYFVISNTKLIIRLFAKVLLFRGVKRKQVVANIKGFLAGFRWLFNKKNDTGYNPYVKNK